MVARLRYAAGPRGENNEHADKHGDQNDEYYQGKD
jgi:hypothetical protein